MKMALVLFLSFAFAWNVFSQTVEEIAGDYHKKAAQACEKIVATLRREGAEAGAKLISQGDSKSAALIAVQIEEKIRGEAVPAPHPAISRLLSQYDAACQTVLAPVRARSLQQFDALLKTSASKDLQVVMKIAKAQEEIKNKTFSEPGNNLLKNPSFAQKFKSWEVHSYRNSGRVVLDETEKFLGKPSLRIENTVEGDTMMAQTVPVKAMTRYRLSAMVKTRDLSQKPGGKGGATLAISGGWESSKAVMAVADWIPLTFDFDTGSRTELEIGPRLGFTSTNVQGTAWFADITLTELRPQSVDGNGG